MTLREKNTAINKFKISEEIKMGKCTESYCPHCLEDEFRCCKECEIRFECDDICDDAEVDMCGSNTKYIHEN